MASWLENLQQFNYPHQPHLIGAKGAGWELIPFNADFSPPSRDTMLSFIFSTNI